MSTNGRRRGARRNWEEGVEVWVKKAVRAAFFVGKGRGGAIEWNEETYRCLLKERFGIDRGKLVRLANGLLRIVE